MTDSALFAGSDADLRYVVMDTAFYKLETFLRPAGKTFIDAATERENAEPTVRVIANASFVHDYGNARLPGTTVAPNWEGEVIQAHTINAGTPASRPDHRYFGQWDGQTAVAFDFERGDPSGVTTPGTFNNAIGGLLPIIKKGVPFGPKTVRDADGTLRVAASNAIAEWTSKHDGTGKIIVGIHRDKQILFVLAQQHGWSPTGGISIINLINRLVIMGVDDAVMGDGSDSVALVFDAVAEVTPIYYKNKSLTTGFAFRRQNLNIDANNARLLWNSATTDPQVTAGYRTQVGFVMTESGGKTTFVLSTLGGQTGVPPLMTVAGITAPLNLVASTTNLTEQTTYTDASGKVSATLSLQGSQMYAGTIVGTMTVTTPGGKAVFDVNWPVTAEDPP